MSRRARRRLIGLISIAVVFVGIGGAAAWFSETYRVFVVRTGSMAPAYEAGDVAVVDARDTALALGDVITFRYSDTATGIVTHRVASVRADGTLITKGDANETTDPWTVEPEDVLGRVAWHAPHLGYLLVYLQQWTGLASLATTVICIALLWDVFFPTLRHETRLVPQLVT